MTTIPGRTQTALLVVDVQNYVVDGAFHRDEVVQNISSLVAQARKTDTSVIWVQHSDAGMPEGSAQWQIVPELEPEPGEPLIGKRYGDAFEATDLAEVLGELNVGKLVVVGAETDACIRSTIHGGLTRGYDVTLVGDAHTAADKTEWGTPDVSKVIAHTNLYWSYQAAPGRTAAVLNTADVDFSAA